MSGMADVVRMHSKIGRDDKGQFCSACGHRYGYAAERTLHYRASEHVAEMLTEAGFGKVEARRTRLRNPHQHEDWQIRDDGRGGRYCAACGEGLSCVTG